MAKQKNIGISVKKEDDLPEWYEQVCLKSELVEFSTVKGCMVIKPRGYDIWDSIQNYFNKNIIEKTGCKNAYFPLFVPESFFKKESKHAEGFNPEVAWIDKEVTKEGERLAIRPTSETIIYDSYSRWIQSYRDLPLKINQWCNVVRWETQQTKLFIRSREFLWQEGHCVYETKEECNNETLQYIKLYEKLCKELLAIPVLVGIKTEKEKFAGAEYTSTIEGIMPDGKALQMGTSHNLGQKFAKAFNINFLGKDEKLQIPWQNSWGLSTRLIGGVVMTHSDNKGLVLPPKLAKNKLVIIPILFDDTKEEVLKKANEIKQELDMFNPILDDHDGHSPGWKYSEWELKGIPLRIEIGPKDLEKEHVVIVKRNTGEKQFVKFEDIKKQVSILLTEIHNELYDKAKNNLKEKIVTVDTWDEFVKEIKNKKVVRCAWCGDTECELLIKDKTNGVTSRCEPFNYDKKEIENKFCPHCGKEAKQIMYFSKSY